MIVIKKEDVMEIVRDIIREKISYQIILEKAEPEEKTQVAEAIEVTEKVEKTETSEEKPQVTKPKKARKTKTTKADADDDDTKKSDDEVSKEADNPKTKEVPKEKPVIEVDFDARLGEVRKELAKFMDAISHQGKDVAAKCGENIIKMLKKHGVESAGDFNSLETLESFYQDFDEYRTEVLAEGDLPF